MYRSASLADTLVQERQNDALEAARAARLARAARSGTAASRRHRWWRRHFEPAPAPQPEEFPVPGSTHSLAPMLGSTHSLAPMLAEIGAAVAELTSTALSDSSVAHRLRQVVGALAAEGRSVGLEPLGSDAPGVVACRWLGRLAERTAGHQVPLDAEPSIAIAGHIEQLRRLGHAEAMTLAAPLPCPAPKRAELRLARA